MHKIQSSPHIHFLENGVKAKDEVPGSIPGDGSIKKFPYFGNFLMEPSQKAKKFAFVRD